MTAKDGEEFKADVVLVTIPDCGAAYFVAGFAFALLMMLGLIFLKAI